MFYEPAVLNLMTYLVGWPLVGGVAMSATACYIYLSAEIVSEVLPFVQFSSFPNVPRGVPSLLAYAGFRVVLSRALLESPVHLLPMWVPSSHISLLLICQLFIAFHNLITFTLP